MVTARLHAPPGIIRPYSSHIAVVGDLILVEYAGPYLVIYRHGIPTPGTLIPRPHGLQSVNSLSTDNHSHFLVSDGGSRAVLVLDLSGRLIHAIHIPQNRAPEDCIVVGEQLWVICRNGDIVVMSPQLQRI